MLREGKDVLPAVVGYLNESFFDVDVRGPVFPHGPKFDKMRLRTELLHGIEQVQGADDVVGLGEDGMLAVDHGIWGAALFAKMDDGLRHESGHNFCKKIIILDIPNVTLNFTTC